VVHAVGPGHGKTIISSYVVANEETVRRGVIISFIAAALQALTAIALVGVATGDIGAAWLTNSSQGVMEGPGKIV
jgi:ABC-type nickel/cobalt efflux system permease component RcnA